MSRQRNHGDRRSMTHKPRQQQRDSMKALSQFMSTRMCCLREKQVVQIMLTLTDKFTHLFLSHTFLYRIAGNFCGAHFHYLATEPSAKMFMCSSILRFNARKPHPPIALHVKYRCVGVYPIFASSFCPHLTKIYRCTVCDCTMYHSINFYKTYIYICILSVDCVIICNIYQPL